jgi:hypothetical protein
MSASILSLYVQLILVSNASIFPVAFAVDLAQLAIPVMATIARMWTNARSITVDAV